VRCAHIEGWCPLFRVSICSRIPARSNSHCVPCPAAWSSVCRIGGDSRNADGRFLLRKMGGAKVHSAASLVGSLGRGILCADPHAVRGIWFGSPPSRVVPKRVSGYSRPDLRHRLLPIIGAVRCDALGGRAVIEPWGHFSRIVAVTRLKDVRKRLVFARKFRNLPSPFTRRHASFILLGIERE
jgi:hypothetical protein